MAAAFAFDPDFIQKQQADEARARERPMVGKTGKTQMEETLMQKGVLEREQGEMGDDDFDLLLQEERKQYDRNEYKTIEQLEDEQVDDDTLEFYRRKRLQELMEDKKRKTNFGGFKEIFGEMFEAEIKQYDGPAVLLLYRPASEPCELMSRILSALAVKFPAVKFRKLLGILAVKDFPAENCPTVMAYMGGQVQGQFVKLDAFAGLKTNADVVEWCLSRLDILSTDLEEDPRYVSAKFNVKRDFVGKGGNRRRPGGGLDSDLDESDEDW